MDINYFLEREQVERVRSQDASAPPAARAVHEELADRYQDMLDDYRDGGRAPVPQ